MNLCPLDTYKAYLGLIIELHLQVVATKMFHDTQYRLDRCTMSSVSRSGRRETLIGHSFAYRLLCFEYIFNIMIIDQSVSLAFWLSIIYPIIAIILATFLFAWSRERVLTWQQGTYRKFMVSRRGIKRLMNKHDNVAKNGQVIKDDHDKKEDHNLVKNDRR